MNFQSRFPIQLIQVINDLDVMSNVVNLFEKTISMLEKMTLVEDGGQLDAALRAEENTEPLLEPYEDAYSDNQRCKNCNIRHHRYTKRKLENTLLKAYEASHKLKTIIYRIRQIDFAVPAVLHRQEMHAWDYQKQLKNVRRSARLILENLCKGDD